MSHARKGLSKIPYLDFILRLLERLIIFLKIAGIGEVAQQLIPTVLTEDLEWVPST